MLAVDSIKVGGKDQWFVFRTRTDRRVLAGPFVEAQDAKNEAQAIVEDRRWNASNRG